MVRAFSSALLASALALLVPILATAQQPRTASTAPRASVSSSPSAASPPALHLPALGVTLDDPGDDRDWRFTTQLDPQSVSVSATAPGGVLAIVMRRARHGQPSCAEHASALFRTREIDALRTMQPVVFRGSPWEPQAFHQRTEAYDAEFGCLRAGEDMWFASAIAQPRASVGLVDLASLASRLARALLTTGVRRDYPVHLDQSGLDVGDPGGDAPWLFLGRAPELLVRSDAISTRAGDAGGVTLTIGRRAGTCPAAWQSLRPGLRTEGILVDRPAYVPDSFGPRIRRITADDRLREIYCAETPAGALVVTAVFRGDDGDAMTRLAPMLRAIARAAGGT
ncbi:MAG: hypothetical protein WCJ30_07280 [Deltaproteobacteria bacterium]